MVGLRVVTIIDGVASELFDALPTSASREAIALTGRREVGRPHRRRPSFDLVAEYGLVANPVKAGLRPPPSAAIGLDRAYHEASVCHQRVDGGIRPLPLTIYAEMGPSIFAQGAGGSVD